METQSKIESAKIDVEDEMSSVPAAPETVRSVNFILDPSAFTLGLGNIERWFNQEYFHSQVKDKTEKICLNLYLPTYTLHELDYQKRGPIVGSTKASQALKFIDRMLESDDGLPDVDFDEIPTSQEKPANQFSHNLFLEHRTNQFPQWSACASYQIRNPSPEDLPLHGKYSLYDEINHVGGDYSGPSGEERDVPSRLKHLIRSGIYLTRMNHNGPPGITGDMWKLVSEDTVSKVWASCFGIDCLNINEAELLLFHGKDLTKFEIKNAGADFFSGKDMYQTEQPDLLHKKVNTTSYKYTDLKALEASKKNKGSGKTKSKKTKKGETVVTTVEKEGAKVEGGVITEDFNMINFAPRDSGSKLVMSTLFAKEKQPSTTSKKAPKRASAKSGDQNNAPETTSAGAASKPKGKPKPKSRKPKKEKNGAAVEKSSTENLTGVAENPQETPAEGPSGAAEKKDPAQKKKTRKRSPKKKAAKANGEGSKTDANAESSFPEKPKTSAEDTATS